MRAISRQRTADEIGGCAAAAAAGMPDPGRVRAGAARRGGAVHRSADLERESRRPGEEPDRRVPGGQVQAPDPVHPGRHSATGAQLDAAVRDSREIAKRAGITVTPAQAQQQANAEKARAAQSGDTLVRGRGDSTGCRQTWFRTGPVDRDPAQAAGQARQRRRAHDDCGAAGAACSRSTTCSAWPPRPCTSRSTRSTVPTITASSRSCRRQARCPRLRRAGQASQRAAADPEVLTPPGLLRAPARPPRRLRAPARPAQRLRAPARPARPGLDFMITVGFSRMAGETTRDHEVERRS